MAELITIARPYAKALFGVACEHNQIEAYYEKLKTFVRLLAIPEVSMLVKDPACMMADRKDILLDLAGEKQDSDVYISNFVSVLSENHRLMALPYILNAYERLMNEQADVKNVVIYTAYPLSDEQINDLLEVIGKRVSGRLQAEVKINGELIGGVKIEIDDKVLDLSIQSRLESLYSALI